MKRLKLPTIALTLCTLLSAVGCSGDKDGIIVRDREGKYYQLGGNTLEKSTYFITEVDTVDVKPFADCR